MAAGAAAWLVLLGVAAVLSGASVVLAPLRSARPDRVVAALLGSTPARLVLVALWIEAGYHLFCQRP